MAEKEAVYVVMHYREWQAMKRDGVHAPPPDLAPGPDRSGLEAWLNAQIEEHSGVALEGRTPTYAFVDKRDAVASMWSPPGKRAVLKVRMPAGCGVAKFDDTGYVCALNALQLGRRSFFLSFSEAEDAEHERCPKPAAVVEASMRRVFAPECFSPQRQRAWVGNPQMRAFIPTPLSRDMVHKVWIYRDQTRIRRRHRRHQ
jgi:hypothetical protein